MHYFNRREIFPLAVEKVVEIGFVDAVGFVSQE
jgi:hypothetical protein